MVLNEEKQTRHYCFKFTKKKFDKSYLEKYRQRFIEKNNYSSLEKSAIISEFSCYTKSG